MDAKDRVLEMYTDAALRLGKALEDLKGTEPGSVERDRFEMIHGERQAYGRVLEEIFGVDGMELQGILDRIHDEKKGRR